MPEHSESTYVKQFQCIVRYKSICCRPDRSEDNRCVTADHKYRVPNWEVRFLPVMSKREAVMKIDGDEGLNRHYVPRVSLSGIVMTLAA